MCSSLQIYDLISACKCVSSYYRVAPHCRDCRDLTLDHKHCRDFRDLTSDHKHCRDLTSDLWITNIVVI